MNDKKYDERHGGPNDRGRADAYYSRDRNPHKFLGDTGFSARVVLVDLEEIEAYNHGYDNEENRKDFEK